METVKASIKVIQEKQFIKIEINDEIIMIPISEDRPNIVKKAFNKLILQIRTDVFQINLENIGSDLFSQVANEYITQLNREILEVYGEMREYNLL